MNICPQIVGEVGGDYPNKVHTGQTGDGLSAFFYETTQSKTLLLLPVRAFFVILITMKGESNGRCNRSRLWWQYRNGV